MKYVKKLLRLLPLFIIISCLLSCIFYSFNQNAIINGANYYDPLYFFGIEGGVWDSIYDTFSAISGGIFDELLMWFNYNISQSYLLDFAFYILVYELFLSLLFLMFDVINLVFVWANKFVNKGVELD